MCRCSCLGGKSRLRVMHLTGLLLHRPNQLFGPKGRTLWKSLQKLKHNGVVEKIGYSVYDPGELDRLWPHFRPDLVQAPYNVLDRRLVTSDWLQRMSEVGVEVHVRSVFLQGLLLMSQSDRINKFDRWSTIWSAWNAWLNSNGFTAIQACLSIVMAEPRISKVIIGVDTLHQLKEILSSTGIKITEYPRELDTNDLDLINPSRWSSL